MRGEENPLGSPSTSDVLFNLILGRRSPIEIARSIGDTPPAVIKHLWRLRRRNIIALAEKSGKFQKYSINWDRLVRDGLDSMVGFATAMVLASLSGDVEKYDMLINVKQRLSESEHFKNLFKAFLEEEAKRMEEEDIYLVTTHTFLDAVEKFERFLPMFFPCIKRDFSEQQKAEFLELLRVLYEALLAAQNYESITLKNALHKKVSYKLCQQTSPSSQPSAISNVVVQRKLRPIVSVLGRRIRLYSARLYE